FSDGAIQTITNLTKRIRLSQLTEQHGDELSPAGKSFSGLLGLVFPNQGSKFVAREVMQKLIEQTRDLYHVTALLYGVVGIHRWPNGVCPERFWRAFYIYEGPFKNFILDRND